MLCHFFIPSLFTNSPVNRPGYFLFIAIFLHVLFHISWISFFPILTCQFTCILFAFFTTIASITACIEFLFAHFTQSYPYFYTLPSLLNTHTQEKMYSDGVKYEPTQGEGAMPPYFIIYYHRILNSNVKYFHKFF